MAAYPMLKILTLSLSASSWREVLTRRQAGLRDPWATPREWRAARDLRDPAIAARTYEPQGPEGSTGTLSNGTRMERMERRFRP